MSKRMLPLVVLAVGMVVLPSSTLNATDGPSPTTEQLIDQLGNNSFIERTQAAQMLRARGPDVLPELRKALNRPDAEVRRQVQELIATLEVIAALQPQRVTLKADQQPLPAILQAIEKQTGYKLHVNDAEGQEPCDLDVQGVPFWEAVERLGRGTGRVVSANAFEKGLRLKREKARSPFVCVSGPFRLEATRFHEDRDVDFTAPGVAKEIGRRDHRLTLTVAVLAEPRFILLHVGRVQVEVALDEDQKTLGCLAAGVKREQHLLEVEDACRQNFQHVAEVFLQRSSPKSRTIRVLRGTVPIQVVVERKRVIVTERLLAAKGLQCQVGGDTLQVTRAELTEDGSFYLSLAVPPKQEGVRWLWHQRVHLEDAKGHRYQPNGSGTSISGGEHGISLHYGKAEDPQVGPPTRLIIENWVTLHHAIPFEFKDVPLP